LIFQGILVADGASDFAVTGNVLFGNQQENQFGKHSGAVIANNVISN